MRRHAGHEGRTEEEGLEQEREKAHEGQENKDGEYSATETVKSQKS